MPRKGTKFVSEFLIPSLNSERFGEHLKWTDKENSKFELRWCHKGGPKWNEEQAKVFVEWDKIKGHYHPEEKSYYTSSKQRFRALLYKLTQEGFIKAVKSGDKTKKIFVILAEKKPRRLKKFSESSNCSSDEISTNTDDELHPTDEVFDDDNFVTNGLEDHNYSCKVNVLEGEVQTESIEYPTSQNEFTGCCEKKILMERNSHYGIDIFTSKDINFWNGITEDSIMEEDFHREFKAVYSTIVEDSNDLTHKDQEERLDENKTPEAHEFLFLSRAELFNYPSQINNDAFY